jgi:hypothetical protein
MPPPASAAPLVPSAIVGYTETPRFTIYANGYAVQGAAADWTYACVDCFIRIAMSTPSIFAAPSGEPIMLAPGTYEIREYRGLIMLSGDTGDFTMVLSGVGKLIRL